MNSFFPNCVKSWNNIGDELSLIRPSIQDIFGIHNPIGIKNIFRLRLGLSQLKVHKVKHNLLDTPSEICDYQEALEDLHHFFNCNQFAISRHELLNDVLDILRKYNLSDLFENPRISFFLHFCPGTMTTHAKSINSALQRGLNRRLRHNIEHRTEPVSH